MQKKRDRNPLRTLYGTVAIVFGGIALLVITALILHINTLSSRIQSLESTSSTLTAQLETYDRTLCSASFEVTQGNQVHFYSIETEGYVRTYQVHTPANYDPSVRYPVILSYDGIEGNGSRMQAYSGLDALPAVVVYLDSLPGTRGFTAWQGAPYSLDSDYDVAFTRAVLDDLPSHYCTDRAKIFAVGMSNGGGFAVIAGCKLGDRIHAVASVSGAYYTSCQKEERTPSFLALHSTTDTQIPFAGSPDRELPNVPGWMAQQAVEERCKTTLPPVAKEGAVQYDWKDCRDEALLRLVVLTDQKHGWLTMPQTSLETKNTAEYIWKFFKDSMYYGT